MSKRFFGLAAAMILAAAFSVQFNVYAAEEYGIFFTNGDNEYDIYAEAENNPLLEFELRLKEGEKFESLERDSIELTKPTFYRKSNGLYKLQEALFADYAQPTEVRLTVNTNLGSYRASFYIVDSTPQQDVLISGCRTDGESGKTASSKIIISSGKDLSAVVSASSLSNSAAYVSDSFDYDNREQIIILNSSAFSNNEIITVTLEKAGWTFVLPENDYNPEERAVLSVTVYNTAEIVNPPGNQPENPNENPSENPPGNQPETPNENPSENPPGNQPETPNENPPGNQPETPNENPSGNQPETPNENPPENPPGNQPENPNENQSGNQPENPLENPPVTSPQYQPPQNPYNTYMPGAVAREANTDNYGGAPVIPENTAASPLLNKAGNEDSGGASVDSGDDVPLAESVAAKLAMRLFSVLCEMSYLFEIAMQK
jgi:hypothetical protein